VEHAQQHLLVGLGAAAGHGRSFRAQG